MKYSELITAGVTEPESLKGRVSRGYIALCGGLVSLGNAYLLYTTPSSTGMAALDRMTSGPLYEFFAVVGAVLLVLGLVTLGPIVIAARRAQKENSS